MALSHRTDWRLNVFMRTKLGEDEMQIQADLNQVLGRDGPSYRTVTSWISSFKDGRQWFEYDPRPGPLFTPCTEENIAAIRHRINENLHIIIDLIIDKPSLPNGSIYMIIQGDLEVRKACFWWVPHHLSRDGKKGTSSVCFSNSLGIWFWRSKMYQRRDE